MKLRLLLALVGLGMAALPMGSVLAADALPSPTPASQSVPSVEQSKRLNRLKTHGASEIDRRLDNLQKALGKVEVSKKLSPPTLQALKSQLQTEIDSLTATKTKLAAETSLAAARTDVQVVIAEYRIYGLVLPKARILATADRMNSADEKFQLLRAQLQRKINLAREQGKDVAALQKSLDDLRAKLASAEVKYQDLAAKLLNLPTADYTASHKVLADAAAGLRTARTELKAAHADAAHILDGLKHLKPATPTPSPSPAASAPSAAR